MIEPADNNRKVVVRVFRSANLVLCGYSYKGKPANGTLAGDKLKEINSALSSFVDFTCLNTGNADIHSLNLRTYFGANVL